MTQINPLMAQIAWSVSPTQSVLWRAEGAR
jgi:hypothetical protein